MKRPNDDNDLSNRQNSENTPPADKKKVALDLTAPELKIVMMNRTAFGKAGFLMTEGQLFTFYDCRKYKAVYVSDESAANGGPTIIEADTFEELIHQVDDSVIAIFYYFPDTRLVLSVNPDGYLGVNHDDLVQYSSNALVVGFGVNMGSFKDLDIVPTFASLFASEIKTYSAFPVGDREFNK